MPSRIDAPIVIGGSRHPALGDAVARIVGIEPRICTERFPDGEIHVRVDVNLGGMDVYVVQALASPVGDAALELVLLADAAWRAGAARVSAIVPYFAYARQDRTTHAGEALGAKVLARVVDVGRFTRVVALDLHAPSVVAGFDAPVDHLTAVPLVVDALRQHLDGDAVVVSPDLGGVKLAESYARALGLPLAVVHKARLSPTEVEAHGIVGDVAGKRAIIVDDMIATGATIAAAVDALVTAGCGGRPMVAATHAVLAEGSLERLRDLDLERVVVTDSLPVDGVTRLPLEVVELAPLLARAIRSLHERGPMDALISHR